jgi:hypothetical protein
MLRRLIIMGFLSLFAYQPALALDARELSQVEIRKAVASAHSLSPRRILDTVGKRVAGEIVDVRVFDADGLCYRVLLVLPSGKLASVVVDAVTGNLLAGNAPRASSITLAARSNPSRKGKIRRKKTTKNTSAANTNSSDNGSGGGGGNSNSGGSRGGNSGNSGGGGNGNSGGNSGNGGGNSGGKGKK